MQVVVEVLTSIARFIAGLVAKLVAWVRTLLRRGEHSAIDTDKLIKAVCLSADKCRVVWPTSIRYPTGYSISTGMDTYNRLLGQKELAVSEIEKALRLHVKKKRGDLAGEVSIEFIPDKSLANDDFKVECFDQPAAVATRRLIGTVKFSQGSVDVEKAPVNGTSKQTVRSSGMTANGGGRTTSRSNRIEPGGGGQWG